MNTESGEPVLTFDTRFDLLEDGAGFRMELTATGDPLLEHRITQVFQAIFDRGYHVGIDRESLSIQIKAKVDS